MKRWQKMWRVFIFGSFLFACGAHAQNISADKINPPDLCINGIIFEKGNSLALINDASYKEGDIIEGATIVAITASDVTVEFAGATFTTALGQGCGATKQMAATIGQTFEQANRQLKSSMGASKKRSIFSVRNRGRLDKGVFAGGIVTSIIFVFLFIATYIYFAYTLQRVAKKTGTTNSWLAWIPIGNFVLMAMIAQRPLWWVPVIIILPVTIIGIIPAVIMIVFIFMDIAAACGKSKWLAALICVPIVNGIGQFFYWGYLAFSSFDGGYDQHIETISEVPLSKSIEEEASQDKQPETDGDKNNTQEPPNEPKKGRDADPPIYNG